MADPVSVRRWLRQLYYRPGWQATVGWARPEGTEAGPDDHLGIYLQVQASDSCKPNATVTIQQLLFVPDVRLRRDFVAWFREQLGSLELHERDEFLRWRSNRTPVVDPHADDEAWEDEHGRWKIDFVGTTVDLSPYGRRGPSTM